MYVKNFPGSPEVKTQGLHCRGHGFDSWLGNKEIPHGSTALSKKKKKKKDNFPRDTELAHQWVAGSGENFFSNNEELEGNFLRKLNDHITKAVPPW